MIYNFQFNQDAISCLALSALIKDGWEINDYYEDNGYSWIKLSKP